MMRNKRILRVIISFIFPVIVIGYCLTHVNILQVADVVSQSSLEWLFLGILVAFFNISIRAYRFNLIITSKNPGLRKLFKIQCLFSMFTYLLPFKSGEISFLYLMKSKLKVQLEESAAMLLVVRVIDYLTISFLFFVMLFLVWKRIPYNIETIILPVILILIFVFLVLFATIWKGEQIRWLLSNLSKKSWIYRNYIVQKFIEKLKEIIVSIGIIHHKKVYTKIICLSLLSWITNAAVFYVIIRSVGFNISCLTAICLVALMFPISFIQGVGDLGTQEAQWIPVLMLFGFSQENAIIVSLSSHVVILLYAMLIGGYGWIASKQNKYPIGFNITG